jgi:hypothetical protein
VVASPAAMAALRSVTVCRLGDRSVALALLRAALSGGLGSDGGSAHDESDWKQVVRERWDESDTTEKWEADESVQIPPVHPAFYNVSHSRLTRCTRPLPLRRPPSRCAEGLGSFWAGRREDWIFSQLLTQRGLIPH